LTFEKDSIFLKKRLFMEKPITQGYTIQSPAVMAGLMSRGTVGAKTGGKGSWRRKEKKVKKGGNVEGTKLWQAATRLGCRAFGALDSVSILFAGQDEALSFDKPELLFDMRANTFIIQGTAVKKPMIEVVQELVSSLDFSKLKDSADSTAAGAAAPAEDDDGIPTDVDFAAPTEGTDDAAQDVAQVD
jgi:stalled ribosome alternative rescue factor ArfA